MATGDRRVAAWMGQQAGCAVRQFQGAAHMSYRRRREVLRDRLLRRLGRALGGLGRGLAGRRPLPAGPHLPRTLHFLQKSIFFNFPRAHFPDILGLQMDPTWDPKKVPK